MFSSSPVFNTLKEQLLQSSFFNGKVLCPLKSRQSYIKTAAGPFHGCGLGKKFSLLFAALHLPSLSLPSSLLPQAEAGAVMSMSIRHTHQQWRKAGEWMNVSTSWVPSTNRRMRSTWELTDGFAKWVNSFNCQFGWAIWINSMWIFNL